MLINLLKLIYRFIIRLVPLSRLIYETKGTSAPITIRTMIFQKILRFNYNAYWPMHFTSFAGPIENIHIGVGTAPGLSRGCYIQAGGKIYIGDYTIIGPNVGIISVNHDVYDYRLYTDANVKIGKYCWIGMNSIILPNVELGDHVIVGAGSVVTKSFPQGYCILAGNPAKVIKNLDKSKCIEYKNRYEYYGYIKKEDFKVYKRKKLKSWVVNK